MNAETELRSAYDEVLRKVGRNLLIFQQAEQALKLLLSWGSIRTSPEQPAAFDNSADVWSTQSMGRLKSRFLDRHCQEPGNPFADLNPEHSGIAMTFTLCSTEAEAEQRRAAIDMLVTERNELVHHLILRINRDSLDDCREISAYLDVQREKSLPAVEQLKEDCRITRKMMHEMIALLMTDEIQEELQVGPIRQCPLVTNLAAIAAENPDPMAWTPLSSAIDRLQDFPSEKINDLVAQFGRKSLRHLLDASQLFELKEELSENGSHRIVLYRLKADSTSKFRV